MKYGLDIKPEGALDFVSLGALNHRVAVFIEFIEVQMAVGIGEHGFFQGGQIIPVDYMTVT